ncbi:MAG TPA: helix-hairpin-helix domain-containing protein, partial [Xanthobacteraceae bacterium]|nr:helix-hairpin-helix domain-containing protein [Xanthobacteraceae bacterium]
MGIPGVEYFAHPWALGPRKAKELLLTGDSLDVDETVAQLLSSEGFATVEDLAFVPIDELASIEGFDEDTANELQSRAKDYLDRIEKELDDKRKSLGVEDAMREVPGVTTRMMVALGENDVKSVEDLAGCATDDLIGWTERKDGETQRHAGYLEGFDLDRDGAEAMIMQARVKAGWIDESALAAPEAEPAEAEEEAQA